MPDAPRKGKRREEKGALTLLLVPSGGGEVRRVAVSCRIAAGILAGTAAVCLGGLLLLGSWLSQRRDQRDLRRLRLNLQAGEARMRTIQARSEWIEQRLQSLDHLKARVEALIGRAGRTGALPSRGGAALSGSRGGAPVAEPRSLDPEQLAARLQSQGEALDALERALAGRLGVLESVPTSRPVDGRPTSEFGWRRSPFGGGHSEFHDGLDLVVSWGTPVRAAAPGRVVSVGFEGAYGNTVRLAHGSGFVSRYGHLSAVGVREGERVGRGRILGRVGSTGRSTGPHLHFMVLRDGKLCDPRQFLGIGRE